MIFKNENDVSLLQPYFFYKEIWIKVFWVFLNIELLPEMHELINLQELFVAVPFTKCLVEETSVKHMLTCRHSVILSDHCLPHLFLSSLFNTAHFIRKNMSGPYTT